MTKHPKDAHISDSASGGKGESMAKESRAEEWLRSILEMDGYMSAATDQERLELLLSECSRLASRVEELRESLRGLAVVSEIVRGSGGLDEQAWCKLCNTREQYIELADIIHKPDCALAQPSGEHAGEGEIDGRQRKICDDTCSGG